MGTVSSAAGPPSAERWRSCMQPGGSLARGSHAGGLRDHRAAAPRCCRSCRHYAYERAVYPQLYVAVVCHRRGDVLPRWSRTGPQTHPRPRRSSRAIDGGGIRRSRAVRRPLLFLTLGLLQAVVNVSPGASTQTLQTLTDASALIESPANWLQRAFLLLAGLATYWSSRLALDHGSFSRVGPCWVSFSRPSTGWAC